MPRNLSGKMVVINTFVPGTTITALSHNENWADAANEISNSLAADGQTPMTGPLQAVAGTPATPAITFSSDTNTGMFRASADTLGFSAGGTTLFTLSATGAVFSVPITGASASLPAGTRMIFNQATAPAGWVKDTTLDDRVLRLVGGASVTNAGTVPFSTFLARFRTDVITLSAANLPPHAHSGTTIGENAAHTHSWGGTFTTAGNNESLDHTHEVGLAVVTSDGGSGFAKHAHSGNIGTTGASFGFGSHTHNVGVGGTTSAEQQAHAHAFTTDNGPGSSTGFFAGIDCRLQYTDVIIAQRS